MYGDSASVAKGGDLTPAVGVQVELHATSGAATAGGKGGLGSKKTDAKGYAMFEFDRVADTGPGGGLVYARATAVAGTALNGRAHTMPVEYEPVDQEVSAGAPFRVLSTRAILEFAVENLSNDGESGGDPMPGWAVHVRADSAKAAPFDTLKSAPKTGKVSVTYNNVKPGQKYYIRLPGSAEVSDTVESQDTAVTKGEAFKLTATAGEDGGVMSVALDTVKATAATQFLTYTHDGMSLPATKMDLGTIAVTFTTQTLIVGVHQERDNIRGYTNIAPGDVRPSAADLGEGDITVSLSQPDTLRGYPVPLKNEDGTDMDTNETPAAGTGLVTYENLDSDINLIVRAEIGGDKIAVSEDRLNVFGTDVNTAKHGTTGAFGEAGGLMPVVHFCPQTTTDGPAYMDDCSTFAYKFEAGEISVVTHSKTYVSPADSVSAAGLSVAVKGIPPGFGLRTVRPAKTDTAGKATFSDLVDGTYEVTVTADSTWQHERGYRPDTVVVLGGTDAGTRNYQDNHSLSHTLVYQKTAIEGTVANDRTADNTVEDEETRRGLVVTLHRKPATGSRYARVASTTTDADGGVRVRRRSGRDVPGRGRGGKRLSAVHTERERSDDVQHGQRHGEVGGRDDAGGFGESGLRAGHDVAGLEPLGFRCPGSRGRHGLRGAVQVDALVGTRDEGLGERPGRTTWASRCGRTCAMKSLSATPWARSAPVSRTTGGRTRRRRRMLRGSGRSTGCWKGATGFRWMFRRARRRPRRCWNWPVPALLACRRRERTSGSATWTSQ